MRPVYLCIIAHPHALLAGAAAIRLKPKPVLVFLHARLHSPQIV